MGTTRQLRSALAPAALALAALTAACGDEPRTPPAGDSAAAASSPAASATLPTPTPAATKNAEEQLASIADYRLTMDKVDRYFAAQRNIALRARAMTSAERDAAEARSRQAAGAANATLEDMVRNVEREPVMHDAVKAAGLSAREFTMITMALMQSGMAAGIAKMRPKDDQDSLARAMKASPENVKFLRDHEAELARKQNALETEMKRMGPADDGR